MEYFQSVQDMFGEQLKTFNNLHFLPSQGLFSQMSEVNFLKSFIFIRAGEEQDERDAGVL